MDPINKIKSQIGIKARPTYYSILGGLVLAIFWIYTTQIKTEGQLPFWDIVDFANETDAENAQEQNENAVTTPANPSPTANPAPSPAAPTQNGDTNPAPPQPAPQPQPVVPPPPPKPLGPYKDGNYSATSTTPWGNVQITLIIKNGQWSNIRYLQIPDSPPSQYAASYLARQALHAQNENIQGVSGATYTSDAFRDDLSQIVKQSKS